MKTSNFLFTIGGLIGFADVVINLSRFAFGLTADVPVVGLSFLCALAVAFVLINLLTIARTRERNMDALLANPPLESFNPAQRADELMRAAGYTQHAHDHW